MAQSMQIRRGHREDGDRSMMKFITAKGVWSTSSNDHLHAGLPGLFQQASDKVLKSLCTGRPDLDAEICSLSIDHTQWHRVGHLADGEAYTVSSEISHIDTRHFTIAHEVRNAGRRCVARCEVEIVEEGRDRSTGQPLSPALRACLKSFLECTCRQNRLKGDETVAAMAGASKSGTSSYGTTNGLCLI